MKERPILFSGPMVRAILEGRKTQTRRICRFRITGPNPPNALFDMYDRKKWIGAFPNGDKLSSAAMNCPYGHPGDRLWVRETWMPDPPIDGWPGDIEWNGCGRSISGVPKHYRKAKHCIFREGWTGIELRWRPGIHMPRWASRITLEITMVRVERLQEISEADVEAEGIKRYRREFGQEGGFPEGWEDSRPGYGGSVWIPSAFKDAFRTLWDSINAKRRLEDGSEIPFASWDANPWVWVIEFQQVKP